MPNYSKTIIAGHITRDIELKDVGSSQVAKFCVVHNDRYKDRSGEQQERATFVDCEAWGKTAEIIAQYHNKGDAILVEGQLCQDSWTDQEGNKRSKLFLKVREFSFIKGKGGGGEQQSQRQPSQGSVSNAMAGDVDEPPF